MVGLSQTDLAGMAKVARATLAEFENGRRVPYERTLNDIQAALESSGVEFIEENGGGAGVRLTKGETT